MRPREPLGLSRRVSVAVAVLSLLPACGRGANVPTPLDSHDAALTPDLLGAAETGGGPETGGGAPDLAAGGGALASSGCTGPALYAPGSQTGQIMAGGRSRGFLVHLPTGHDPRRPMPLVVLLHGALGTGAQAEASSLMSPIADREGFAVVYPEGVSRSWNAGRCCGPPSEQKIDDVGFIAALLDHLESGLCLDRRRLYASGMSNGAMMSHRLGCELSDRLAAIAPVAGPDMTEACTPKRAVPVLHTHGTDDRHVPWQGGVGCGVAGVAFSSVPDTLAGWLARNHCQPATPTPFVEQGNGRCERQGACAANAEVILCTIAGGGHSWPGGAAKDGVIAACEQAGEGPQSRTFFASEQIWSFFKAHALP